VTSKAGNTCINRVSDYKCNCGNAGYKPDSHSHECLIATSCNINHCIAGGDPNGVCSDLPAPNIGYSCTCSPGFAFDGTTCTDVNECVGGGNPCAHGDCNNTPGGYTCTCEAGFASTGGAKPTCVASTTANGVSYTVDAGSGCQLAGTEPARDVPELLLLCGVLFFWSRRPRRR
jgi:hypothetical protein